MADVRNRRLVELQRENESLSAAADEAATMLEELAADGKRLRTRIAELEAHAAVSSEIEGALRESVQELATQLADIQANPLSFSGHDIVEALGAYLPDTAAADTAALHALLHATAARARARQAIEVFSASARCKPMQNVAESALKMSCNAMLWIAADPSYFHIRGSSLLSSVVQLEERLCGIVSAFDPGWTENQLLLKAAVLEKAVEAVRVSMRILDTNQNSKNSEPCDDTKARRHQSNMDRAEARLFEEEHQLQSSINDVSVDLVQVTSLRASRIRAELELAGATNKNSESRAISAEASAAGLALELRKKTVELEDMAVRCDVFERKLGAQSTEYNESCDKLEAEILDQRSTIEDLQKSLEMYKGNMRSTAFIQDENDEPASVEVKARNVSASGISVAQSNLNASESVMRDPQLHISVKQVDILEQQGRDSSPDCAENDVDMHGRVQSVGDQHLSRLLADSRDESKRLRRALTSSLVESFEDDMTCEERSAERMKTCEAVLKMQSHRRALSLCLKQGKRSAASARVLKLQPVTMNIVDEGATLSTHMIRDALKRAHEAVATALPLPPPICSIHAPNGEIDRSTSQFLVLAADTAPRLCRALSLHEIA